MGDEWWVRKLSRGTVPQPGDVVASKRIGRGSLNGSSIVEADPETETPFAESSPVWSPHDACMISEHSAAFAALTVTEPDPGPDDASFAPPQRSVPVRASPLPDSELFE